MSASLRVLPLRVLVVDDEAMARKRAVRLLGAIAGVEVCGECESGEEALLAVEQGDVDVVLLDVQMPGLTGIDAKALMPEDGPYVVFATAHPEHAVRAFEVGGGDYVLKPIDAARLKKALDRARKHLERPRAPSASSGEVSAESSESGPVRLAVETREGIVLLVASDISHAVLDDGSLVTIHAAGRAWLSDATLNDLQAKLPASLFERVHRRALLNLDHVRLLEPQDTGGYIARTTGGAAVEVSRQAARKLRRRLGLG